MTSDELRALSPEQAMQATAQAQGLPPDFYDRMWNTESGRGKNMRSRVGAEGHFQIMPNTRATWEKRSGRAYDPDNFYDGLELASMTMGENLAKFKDVTAATRAYNAGWNQSRWDNPETNNYVSKILGVNQPVAVPKVPQEGVAKARQEQDAGYPVLPTARAPSGAPGGSSAAERKAAEQMGTLALLQGAANRDRELDNTEAAQDAESARQVEAVNKQALADKTGVGAAFDAAISDPRVMPTFTVIDALTSDREVTPQGWSYMDNIKEIEAPCGGNDDCRAYLRENVTGPVSMRRAQAQMAYRQDLDNTYANAGGFATFAGQMGAGLMDPVSFIATLGVGKVFQAAKIGHAAATMQKSAVAATAAYVAEGALGNVALEGIQDALGEVKTSSDYAMAATMGAILTAPFARGVYRGAANDYAQTVLHGIKENAAAEQIAKVAKAQADDPTATPSEVARRVEQQEAADVATTTAENASSTSPFARRVIPEDVAKEIREVAEGSYVAEEPKVTVTAEATVKVEEPTPAPPLAEQRATTVADIQEGKPVSRVIDDGPDMQVRLDWNLKDEKLSTNSAREVFEALAKNEKGDGVLTYLSKVMSADAQDLTRVRFQAIGSRSYFKPDTATVMMRDAAFSAKAKLDANVAALSDVTRNTLAHELVHAATSNKIAAWQINPGALKGEAAEIFTGYQELFNRFRKHLVETGVKISESGPGYAAKNLDEFAAMVLTDMDTQTVLRAMPGKPVYGKPSSAFAEFVRLVRKTLGIKSQGQQGALLEASRYVDAIITMDPSGMTYANGTPALFAPLPPPVREKMAIKWANKMEDLARHYLAANPIDLDRTKVLTDKIGGTSDGLVMARSKNPIMQMIAGIVTETTTGAAGRGPTVAIHQPALNSKYLGNFRNEFDNAYLVFRNMNKGSAWEDIYRGDVKRLFNEQVYEEIRSRRASDYTPTKHPSIREAADAAEKVFERARQSQIDSGTMGSGYLPTSAKGYVPQALDGAKLANASTEDLAALGRVLGDHFMEVMGWDRQFAQEFAPRYIERARLRMKGSKEFDMQAAGGDTMGIVRDTLEDLGRGTGELAEQALATMNRAGGLGQVKKRLDIPMDQEVRKGLKVSDFYVTDVDLLTRQYARRTSGNVALNEVGIQGNAGMRQLRAAMERGRGETDATRQELDAFDRVLAEIMGSPVEGRVISAGATNLRLLVSLQRLGGLVFTQMAEGYNMLHTLGLRSTLDAIPTLPRMLGEVGRQKKGLDARNPRLWSVETIGGEIGQESYKIIAPLDAPNHALGAYMDDPGLFSRVLRSGGHLQAKISGFRGLMAAQHRMVAEQIVMKATRMIRDGGADKALADMGFTKEVSDGLREQLKTIASWDKRDSLERLDLTQVDDPRLAEAFVQAVHRGTSQIIQGTFAGERNKWFHNDYLGLLLQLRTFGLTATEKQWGRTTMNHGYTYAAAFMVGQIALSMPIHAARVNMMSVGREDRKQYLEDNLNPAALVRASMNYASLTGMGADVIEGVTGVAGGWLGDDAKEALGIRKNTVSVGRIVPAAGTIDQAAKAIRGDSSLYNSLKQLPFSNLWYLAPALNLTKHD